MSEEPRWDGGKGVCFQQTVSCQRQVDAGVQPFKIKDKDDQDGQSQIRRERVGGWVHHAVGRKQRLCHQGSRRQCSKGYGEGVGGSKRQ